MLKSPLPVGRLRMLGCLTAAAGLTLAVVPAAQAGTPFSVSIWCNSFVINGLNEVQCDGGATGGSGNDTVQWTASGYTSIFEKTTMGFGAYCNPGAALYVEISVSDTQGNFGQAHWNGTCV
jgi:hypothetical protein